MVEKKLRSGAWGRGYLKPRPYIHCGYCECTRYTPLLRLCSLQLYGLWKSRGEEADMSSDPVETTSRGTVTQLNQEIERLQNELQEVCDVM